MKLFTYSYQQKKALSFREKRFNLFLNKLNNLKKPIKILDVGGTQKFWNEMNYIPEEGVEIVLLNLQEEKETSPGFSSIIGSATNLSVFKNNSFDIVFSNSVIEHLYNFENQVKMANEVMRVGKLFFVQCPNKYFLIEPHFNLPYFQFYPFWVKHLIMKYTKLVRGRKYNIDEIHRTHNEIKLLSYSDLLKLFPGAKIYKEKIFGLTKSFITNNMDIH